MKVRAAILALLRNADMIRHLNFGGAIVAARDQVELRFDPPARSSLARRRFWLSFPVGILISGLTIFSRHIHPQKSGGLPHKKFAVNCPPLKSKGLRVLNWIHPGGACYQKAAFSAQIGECCCDYLNCCPKAGEVIEYHMSALRSNTSLILRGLSI